MIVHSVYFVLKDNSPEKRQELIDDAKRYIAEVPDVEYFTAGVLCEEMKRDVNVRDYDVSLLVVLTSLDALKVYGADPGHTAFIEKHKANWTSVRVFDSEG